MGTDVLLGEFAPRMARPAHGWGLWFWRVTVILGAFEYKITENFCHDCPLGTWVLLGRVHHGWGGELI